jgi:hypothetical protein
MNNFGALTWKVEELSKSVNFLDLTITIGEDRRIVTKNLRKIDESVPVHSTGFGSSSRRAEKHCLWQLTTVLATELFEI